MTCIDNLFDIVKINHLELWFEPNREVLSFLKRFMHQHWYPILRFVIKQHPLHFLILVINYKVRRKNAIELNNQVNNQNSSLWCESKTVINR